MEDALGFSGKTVVVTGSASGMGGAAAQILTDLGARVIGVDIKPTTVAGATSLIVDLRDKAAIDEAAAGIDGPVQAVCSSAGLPGPPFSDLDTMLVNFVGGRHLIESLVPKMPEGGAICCVASNAGLGWQQNLAAIFPLITTEGFDAGRSWLEENTGAYENNGYGFSKQVLNAWCAWRAASLIKQGLRLNNINPGPTQTPMMPAFHEAAGKDTVEAFLGPVERYSTPEEQAWPMVVLCSPRLSIVNGVGLATDGGFEGALFTGQIDVSALMPGGEG